MNTIGNSIYMVKRFLNVKVIYPINYYRILRRIEKSLSKNTNSSTSIRQWVDTTCPIAKDLCIMNIFEPINVFNQRARRDAIFRYCRRLRDIHDTIEDGIAKQEFLKRYLTRENDKLRRQLESMRSSVNNH